MKIDLEKIIFTKEDLEPFKDPDDVRRTISFKKKTLPKLKALRDHTIKEIEKAFGINPLDNMCTVCSPNSSRDTENPIVFDYVFAGLSGRSGKGHPIRSDNPQGKKRRFCATYLRYEIVPEGSIYTKLVPFIYSTGPVTLKLTQDRISESWELLSKLFNKFKLHFQLGGSETIEKSTVLNAFDPFSTDYHNAIFYNSDTPIEIPTKSGDDLRPLIRSFIALYPIAEFFVAIERGQAFDLKPRLSKLGIA